MKFIKEFIDTHAHLNFADYEKEPASPAGGLDLVVQRSLDQGVGKIICVSSNLADSKKAIALAAKYPGIVFAAVGIHPQCTDPENKTSIAEQLKELTMLAEAGGIVAIGECGLDYTEPPENERKRNSAEQAELLKGQLEIANKKNLPILIHCNKAHDELLEVLKSYPSRPRLAEADKPQAATNLRGIFHFYCGGKKRLKNFLEFKNFLFGVTGTLTYDEGIINVIKEIPLEKLVLETDCPFLAPNPYRGSQNEPSFIPLIAAKLAEIKNTTLDEVAKATTNNANRLFNL